MARIEFHRGGNALFAPFITVFKRSASILPQTPTRNAILDSRGDYSPFAPSKTVARRSVLFLPPATTVTAFVTSTLPNASRKVNTNA